MNKLLHSRLFDNDTFYDAFVMDLRSARYVAIIESPFITTKRMKKLIPVVRSLRQKRVDIIVNTRSPEEHDADYALQAIQAINILQELDVKVLYTVKHHRKLAIIDNKILWEGSLNILSQNDSCEIMRRTVSKELAKEMVSFTGLDKFI